MYVRTYGRSFVRSFLESENGKQNNGFYTIQKDTMNAVIGTYYTYYYMTNMQCASEQMKCAKEYTVYMSSQSLFRNSPIISFVSFSCLQIYAIVVLVQR